VPIIRRKYHTYETSGISHSIQMTVRYAGWNGEKAINILRKFVHQVGSIYKITR